MLWINEFSSTKNNGETVVSFNYPLDVGAEADFLPSLRDVFLRGIKATEGGMEITSAKVFAEAVQWLNANVREGDYRLDGRFEKIVAQTRRGREVMVDGDGVRWAVVFRFIRDEDAVAFRLRFG